MLGDEDEGWKGGRNEVRKRQGVTGGRPLFCFRLRKF